MTGHPAVDTLTGGTAIILQDRPVVPLSPWLVDAARFCADSSRTLALVTPRTSRLTVPCEILLSATDCRWVVRDGDTYLDGARGVPLRWDGDRFVAEPATSAAAATLAAEHPPEPVVGGTMRVDVAVLHRASAGLQIGGLVEDCVAALTDGEVDGWGVAEPVSQPWNRQHLTDFARGLAPRPVTVVVVGGSGQARALGWLDVNRRRSGVVERLRLAVGTMDTVEGTMGTDGPDMSRLDALARRLLEHRPVRTMLASLHPGRSDGTVVMGDAYRRVPYGFAIGAEGVAERGAAHARAAPAPFVEVVGSAANLGCWMRLTGGTGRQANPGQVLADITRYFGMAEGRRPAGGAAGGKPPPRRARRG